MLDLLEFNAAYTNPYQDESFQALKQRPLSNEDHILTTASVLAFSSHCTLCTSASWYHNV